MFSFLYIWGKWLCWSSLYMQVNITELLIYIYKLLLVFSWVSAHSYYAYNHFWNKCNHNMDIDLSISTRTRWWKWSYKALQPPFLKRLNPLVLTGMLMRCSHLGMSRMSFRSWKGHWDLSVMFFKMPRIGNQLLMLLKSGWTIWRTRSLT